MPRAFASRRLFRGFAVLAVSAPLAVCAPAPAYLLPQLEAAPSYMFAAAPSALATERALTEHVIVISIDGLRADAIERAGAHTLQRLMQEGAYSLQAKTILPSITLPSHTSMITGATPEMHGVLWNDERLDEMGTIETPTMFGVARQAGYHTAAFFSKPKFQHLMVPGTLDYGQAPEGNGRWYVGHTVESVERYLKEASPNLTFVHIGEPDYAGHTIGWGSAVSPGCSRQRMTRSGRETKRSSSPPITADMGGPTERKPSRTSPSRGSPGARACTKVWCFLRGSGPSTPPRRRCGCWGWIFPRGTPAARSMPPSTG